MKLTRRALLQFFGAAPLASSTLGNDGSGGVLAVAVDVSGSVDAVWLHAIESRLRAMVTAFNPAQLRVLYFHHRIVGIDVFGRPRDGGFAICGIENFLGGGTNYDALFDGELNDPDAMLIFTDGWGSVSVQPPTYPVVWVTTDNIPNFCMGQFGDFVRL